MPRISVLFIDKGGVLVDNDALPAQWQRLLGEFLPAELGSTADRWAEANRISFPRTFERFLRERDTPGIGITAYFRLHDRFWMWEMCDLVGVPRPDERRTDDLVRRSTRYVRERLVIGTPETIASVRALKERGLTLHLASGDRSEDLVDLLRSMASVTASTAPMAPT